MQSQQSQYQQYPTPQQQQFYQLQQQQQQNAAPGTPPGMNSSWNTYAAPMGIDNVQFVQPGQQLQQQGGLNGSMNEIPYASQPQMVILQQQPNLNPTAQPFVSNTNAAPGQLVRENSQDSTGSGTPTTPGTAGKRRNNPYAQTAVVDQPQQGGNPSPGVATVSPVALGGSVSPVSPGMQGGAGFNNNGSMSSNGMGQASQSWGSPASGAGFPGFSPVAAPLPSSLPQRDGPIRGHRSGGGRGGGHNQNYAGPHQGGQQHGGGNHMNHPGAQGQPVTHEDVMAQAGTYVDLARTANGSSFIQAAVREGSDPANLQTIWSELSPCLSDLFLDAHGCYVIKSVMERLPAAQLQAAVMVMANDPQLVFSMCTHSLHTRRVVQFLLDSMDCPFIFNLLTTHCAEIAMTQQGCIVMQRAMDTSTGQAKLDLYNAIYGNLLRFCTDPFANYVVQHMLEVGDKAANSAAFRHNFLAHTIQLSCNKFASNVMEKALFHLDEQLQHELLVAIYDAGEDVLYRMLQDSFGNYLIQSSIALAQYKDVFFISEKLRPVLQRTPYGHKIEGRLDRRLKGKAVGTRSPMIGATFKANQGPAPAGQQQPQQGQQQQGQGGQQRRGGSGGYNRRQNGSSQSVDSFSGNSDDAVEEPW